jgi:hypothetical protein
MKLVKNNKILEDSNAESAEINAEFNATEELRGGRGWATRKNAPKNGGMAA